MPRPSLDPRDIPTLRHFLPLYIKRLRFKMLRHTTVEVNMWSNCTPQFWILTNNSSLPIVSSRVSAFLQTIGNLARRGDAELP